MFTRITRKAQRLNVVNVAAPALANRLDVVCGKLYVIPTTPKAFVSVVIAKFFEFCDGIKATSFSFSCAAAVIVCNSLAWVSTLPLSLLSPLSFLRLFV